MANFDSTEKDIASAKDSFQELYDKQIALIEIDLGMPIEEAISKYATFDEKVRKSVDAAKEKVRELNQETRELEIPVEKMVTIGVQFKQYGEMPVPHIGKLNIQGMQQYADGGFANRASIFGEAGLEAAIPINNSQRSRDLYAMTGRMLGMDSESSESVVIHFSPTVNVPGGGGDVARQVTAGLKMSLKEFENLFEQMKHRRQRVGLGAQSKSII